MTGVSEGLFNFSRHRGIHGREEKTGSVARPRFFHRQARDGLGRGSGQVPLRRIAVALSGGAFAGSQPRESK